jgi:hypothetical protein
MNDNLERGGKKRQDISGGQIKVFLQGLHYSQNLAKTWK